MITPKRSNSWKRLILCSVGALFSGWVLVSCFILSVSVYGISPDYGSSRHAMKALPFPENEQMLNAMTAQLAREGRALSKIEPAAGPTKNK